MVRRVVSIVSVCALVCFSIAFRGGVPAEAGDFTAQDVNSIVALGKMRGHLLASLPLWGARQYDLAWAHAGHPVEELFALVAPALKAKTADAALKKALDDYGGRAGKAGDAAAVRGAHTAALAAVDAAKRTLAGPWLQDPRFQSQVVHGLLEGVEEEYSEGVSGGKITKVIEYQDAKGFLAVAQEAYAAVEPAMKAGYPREHDKIKAQFAALGPIFPDFVTPPAKSADLKKVKEAVDEIAASLRVLGARAEAARTPKELLGQVRAKVAQALKEYKEGKVDEAYELAASAYLDGFEHLEPGLVSKNRELVERLEGRFATLRNGIKAKRPIAELEALAKAINADLDKVQALL